MANNALSNTWCNLAHGSSGLNGVGKLMTPKTSIGTPCFILGSTEPDGYLRKWNDSEYTGVPTETFLSHENSIVHENSKARIIPSGSDDV